MRSRNLFVDPAVEDPVGRDRKAAWFVGIQGPDTTGSVGVDRPVADIQYLLPIGRSAKADRVRSAGSAHDLDGKAGYQHRSNRCQGRHSPHDAVGFRRYRDEANAPRRGGERRLRPSDEPEVRQGYARVRAGFENRGGANYRRIGRRRAARVGCCGENDGRPTQTGGEDLIGFVIAARKPVRLGKQKIDPDDPRRCRSIHQTGELIARPRPLPEVTNGLAVNIDRQGVNR